MNHDYPKLLLVNSQAFHYENGPGITLSNLFRGWPVEKIAMVHDDHIETARDVCNQYYVLGEEESRWILPVAKLVSAYRNKLSVSGNKKGIAGLRKSVFKSIIWSRFEAARELLQPRDMLLRYQVGPRLSNWVKSFAPDIIYTQPSSICHMSLARQIQMLSGAKMAIHIMDDWPMLFMQPDMSHRLRARKTLDLFQQMIDHSSLRLTISNKMAKEYQRRYGCEFIPFHNPAILEERYADLPSAEKSPPPLKIIYSGGISSRNQLSALKTICQSIGLLNKSGLSVEFHIYTHPRWQALYSKELQFEHVLFKPYVSDQAEISRIYRESELLIIPLSFDRESLKYVSLSMPTKVSSYMASGTPILVYASPETALADYAKEEGWAFVVSEPQEEGLRRMLHLALTSDEMRKQYRERALTVVKENHEAQAVQKKFQSLLLSVGDHRVV